MVLACWVGLEYLRRRRIRGKPKMVKLGITPYSHAIFIDQSVPF